MNLVLIRPASQVASEDEEHLKEGGQSHRMRPTSEEEANTSHDKAGLTGQGQLHRMRVASLNEANQRGQLHRMRLFSPDEAGLIG